MNWERAKSILIIFFLLINIGLAGILVHMRHDSATLSEEAVDSTVALLAQHRIVLKNKEIIPKQKFKNQNYNLTTLSFDKEKTLESWLGKGYHLAEKDTQAHQYIYQNNNKHLTINKTGIEFATDKKAVLLSSQSEKEMQNFLTAKLKKLGFRQKDYYFRNVWFENGLYHGIISPLVDDTKIIGVEFHLSADKDEIIQISGNWFAYSGKENFDADGVLDITAVMANMIYLQEKPTAEITDISYAAYVSDEYLDNKVVTAVPAYIFQCADGQEFHYDARSGELLG